MVSTGIPSLDTLLNNDGYPDRSSVLVVGPPGIGKEALGYWFTQTGLVQSDFCLYVTRLSVHIERAVELDPLSPVMHLNLGVYYYSKRDYARAIESFKRAVELGMKSAHGNLVWAYGTMKMYDQMEKEAEAWAMHEQETAPLFRIHVDAHKACFMGNKETLRRLIPELEAHPVETDVPACEIADFYFSLDDTDKGFEWLERYYSKKESALLGLASNSYLDGVRTDPRYLDLLKRLGLD